MPKPESVSTPETDNDKLEEAPVTMAPSDPVDAPNPSTMAAPVATSEPTIQPETGSGAGAPSAPAADTKVANASKKVAASVSPDSTSSPKGDAIASKPISYAEMARRSRAAAAAKASAQAEETAPSTAEVEKQ